MSVALAEDLAVRERFKKQVCRRCGLCGNPRSVEFCLHLLNNAQANFTGLIIKGILTLKASKKIKDDWISTLFGFNTVFCGKINCINYKKKYCNTGKTKVDCYESFCVQRGRYFDNEEKALLIELFDKVGHLNTNKKDVLQLWRELKKKPKRSIKKRVGAIRSAMVSKKSKPKHKSKKTTRKIVTAFFYNRNAEWEAKIEEYLGTDPP